MSGKVMGHVWDLDLPHSQMLVLLALADHADHQGENIHPSLGLVAWKVGYSKRQVQRVVRDLKREGLLIEVKPASNQKAVTYKINFATCRKKPPFMSSGDDKMSSISNDTGDTLTSQGVT